MSSRKTESGLPFAIGNLKDAARTPHLQQGIVKAAPKTFKASLRKEMLITMDDVKKARAAGTPLVDGIPVPLNLAYAPNHMWLDVGDDGCRHVGIDAFLARIIGTVDAISFVGQANDPSR